MSELDPSEIVRLAIASCPQRPTAQMFRESVWQLIPEVWMMLQPDSKETAFARRLVDSKMFTGEIVGLDVEATSNRGVVSILSATGENPDEPEHVRTERLDDGHRGGGPTWEALQRCGVGGRGLFVVHVGSFDKEAKGKKQSLHVRVLQTFIPFSSSKPAARQPAQVRRDRSNDRSVDTRADETATEAALRTSKAIFEKLNSVAPGLGVVRYSKALADLGVTDPLDVPAEHLAAARTAARSIVDGLSATAAGAVEEAFPGATYEEEEV